MIYGSVCSGIEAASVAWEPLGFVPAWFSEIEPFPIAVLAHHWPHITNLGDMTKIATDVLKGDVVPPDILVGGTPCQAFSVAGAREGLADDRGFLTIKYVELANAIDQKRAAAGAVPCITVWENVPGVLSSKDNAFGAFLGFLAGEDCELVPPGKKWENAGCVLGPQRAIAWRILDAQYFGVAQRRRRVFVVASARTDFDPAKVLFEREGVRRDTAPERGEGGQTAYSIKNGSHWDDPSNPHPTLNQSFNTGGIGASNQEIFSQRGSGIVPCWWNGGQVSQTLDAVLYKGQMMPEKNRFPVVLDGGPIKARKITPVEAERLQGFQDGHTNVPYRGKPAADGPRYKAIGNSMAVPVMRWIGERIKLHLEAL